MSGSRRPWDRSRTSMLILLAVLSAVAASPASAADDAATAPRNASTELRDYALQEGPLIATLHAISRQSGVPIRFDASTLRGMTARPVDGAFSVMDAVRRAIDGQGLAIKAEPDGSLVLSTPANGELTPVTVTAQRTDAETTFKADRSDTATRVGTDLLDLPEAITVITAKVLETQQALTPIEALANVSSVTFSQSPQGSAQFSIRGFNSTALTVNGLADSSAISTSVNAIDRIEVLKGPQAVLAGSNSLGGAVNIVMKKPQAETLRTVGASYGYGQDRSISADLSGAVVEGDKRLTYRLIGDDADASTSEGGGGYRGRREVSVLPQLRWKTEGVDVTAGMSNFEHHAPMSRYTVTDANANLIAIPTQRLGSADDGFDTHVHRSFYDATVSLSNSVELVSRMAHANSVFQLHLYEMDFSGVQADGTALFYPLGTVIYGGATSGDHYLRFHAASGPLDQKISVGINHENGDSTNNQVNVGAGITASLYAPNGPGFAPVDLAAVLTSSLVTHTQEHGYYVQDLLSLGRWNLSLNARRNHFNQTGQIFSPASGGFPASTSVFTPLDAWHTTPGAGLVYKVTDDASAYMNYAQGFVPQQGQQCGSGNLPPTLSSNEEAGMKWNLLDDRLALTSSLFHLKQTNTPIYNTLGNCYLLVPSQITKGLELDLQGRVMDGWNAIANYTYNIVSDPADPTVLYAGLPRSGLSLWSVHQLPNEPVAGLSLAYGLTLASPTEGSYTTASHFEIPAQVRVDASLIYSHADWNVNLALKNVTDHNNFGASGFGTYVPLLNGRVWRLSISHDFH